jgi:hypothetical protein
LIGWLYTVLHLENQLPIWKRPIIARRGFQNLGLCSGSWYLSREGFLSSPTCCDIWPRFFLSRLKDYPFSRLLRHTKTFWGSILTISHHSVASYDKQMDVEHIFSLRSPWVLHNEIPSWISEDIGKRLLLLKI